MFEEMPRFVDQCVGARYIAYNPEVIGQQESPRQRSRSHQQRREAPGPPEAVDSKRRREDGIGRAVACNEAADQTRGERRASRTRTGEKEKRGDYQ